MISWKVNMWAKLILETKKDFENIKTVLMQCKWIHCFIKQQINFMCSKIILKNLSRILKPLCLSSSPWLWSMRLNQNAKGYLNNSNLTKTIIYTFYTPSNILSSSNTSSWKLSRIVTYPQHSLIFYFSFTWIV